MRKEKILKLYRAFVSLQNGFAMSDIVYHFQSDQNSW